MTLEQFAADENTSPEQLWELALTTIKLARIVARNSSTEF